MARRDTPQVEVAQGRLAGRWKRARGRAGRPGQPVAVFRGVPFAAPPVGDRRWRPPVPPEPWTGVRVADSDGPMAIQREVDLELFLHNLLAGQGWSRARVAAIEALVHRLPRPHQGEDCLYLTVRTPAPDRSARLPVMVWIHGGDHQDGSGTDVFYAANALAARGVVTVAINYRLGVMGYLAHPELVDESDHGVAGNYGTLDQIAALRWVRDNIEAFGGDPGNVTIFGESAGGESILHLMTSPLARGLFHRAAAQSPANGGQMIHLDHPFRAHDSAKELSLRFAAGLGITGPGQVSRLRALTPDQLYEFARTDRELGSQYPVIDGHVLPRSPFAAFASGAQAPVPFVIGSNADEGSLIQPAMETPMAEFRHRPRPALGLQPEVVEAFGSDLDLLLAFYPGLDRQEPQAEIDFLGDHLFGAPAYYYAHHHRLAGNAAWLYLFARTPKAVGQTAGAYHAAEVAFVHGSRVPILPMTRADKALSAEMMRYWTDFAASGDPNGSRVGAGASTGPDHPSWPRFDPDRPEWIWFDHAIAVGPVDRRPRYDVLNARTDRLVEEMSALPTG